MKKLILLFILLTGMFSVNAQENNTASDNECTIIFYRKNKPIPLITAALVIDVNCKNSDEKICNLRNATYYKYVTSELDVMEITASVVKESKPIKVKLEAGKTYYVNCWVKDDLFFRYGAGIEIVSEKQALKDIGSLEEVE